MENEPDIETVTKQNQQLVSALQNLNSQLAFERGRVKEAESLIERLLNRLTQREVENGTSTNVS